jgi:hypothetical protein
VIIKLFNQVPVSGVVVFNIKLTEAIEGHHYSRAKSGLYEHYERLGIGKSKQFVYDSLQLLHSKLYYYNVIIKLLKQVPVSGVVVSNIKLTM